MSQCLGRTCLSWQEDVGVFLWSVCNSSLLVCIGLLCMRAPVPLLCAYQVLGTGQESQGEAMVAWLAFAGFCGFFGTLSGRQAILGGFFQSCSTIELGNEDAEGEQMWRGITFLFHFHLFVHRSPSPCPCLSSSPHHPKISIYNKTSF